MRLSIFGFLEVIFELKNLSERNDSIINNIMLVSIWRLIQIIINESNVGLFHKRLEFFENHNKV